MKRFASTLMIVLTLAACSQKAAQVKDFSDYYYTERSGAGLPPSATDRVREMRLQQTVKARAGDEMYTLAERYGTTSREIIEFNKLTPPYSLREGQEIKLPRPQLYAVRHGETLQSISKAHGVDISELARINDLKAPYAVQPRQQLRMPYRAYSGSSSYASSSYSPNPFASSNTIASAPTVGGSAVEVGELGSLPSKGTVPARTAATQERKETSYVFSQGDKGQAKAPIRVEEHLEKVEKKEESSWTPFKKTFKMPDVELPSILSGSSEKVLPDPIKPEAPKQNFARSEQQVERAETPAPVRVEKVERRETAFARAPELVRTTSEAAPSSPENFAWPVKGKVISKFGPSSGGVHNDGINIAAPVGTEVHASAAGEVIYTGTGLKSYGKLVIVKHRDGWVTAYAHNSEILVKTGAKVKKGQVISRSGNSGRVEKPQLHFAIRKGSDAVDPLPYLGG